MLRIGRLKGVVSKWPALTSFSRIALHCGPVTMFNHIDGVPEDINILESQCLILSNGPVVDSTN